QTIYTGFYYIIKKVQRGEDLVKVFRDRFEKTKLFIPAGNEVKFVVQRKLSGEQIKELIKLVLDLAEGVRKRGLTELAA
ncbi:hypothetical protein KAU55_05425, partial [Candidatus Bathyarchaeota archaeon]|nr:hypothetical protein [Candidatus Bathyarchaeota archaeon]